jgi:hypothetical protein
MKPFTGSLGTATAHYYRCRLRYGENHPATRAAWGRVLAHKGWVPQRGAVSPEVIAWHRQRGARGYLSRHYRGGRLAATLADARRAA